MDKISSSALDTFYSYTGEISYKYLTDIKNCLNKIDDNISLIENLFGFIDGDNFDICVYRNNYYDSILKISENSLFVQKIFYKLISYSHINFSISKQIDNNSNSLLDQNIEKILENNFNNDSDNTITNSLNNGSTIDNTNKIDTTSLIENNYDVDNNSSSTNLINSSSLKKKEKNDYLNSLTENELLISEIQQKVVLPYTKKELQEILNTSNEYDNYSEIIEKKYTIPLSYYKYSAISRFKEAYTLIKKNSNVSIKEAFDLGLELFFRYDLNPAIITACKNIDELDIYIACLDDNELDNFKCFSIKFEMLPTISKIKNTH